MLERLQTLEDQRDERSSEPDMWAPTTVEPLPPADALIPEEHRPTIKQIPRELQHSLEHPPRSIEGGQAPRTGAEIVDGLATSKVERVAMEPTPEPLPPQPEAEQAAASWFESVPTSLTPSVGPFGQLGDSQVGPESAITPVHQRDGAASDGAQTRPEARSRGHRVTMQLGRSAWTMPLLIAATAFAVGMVFGALLFGDSGDNKATGNDGAGVCEPCPEPAGEIASPPPGDGFTD